MKYIIKNILLAVSLMLVIVSCRDEDKNPVPIDETLANRGAHVRTIGVTAGKSTFDLFDLANSEFEIELEIFDEQQGALLESVDFTVELIDNTPLNADATAPQTAVTTISASEFTTDATTGLPRYTYSATGAAMLSLLGVNASELDGGDAFRFEWTLNLTNGKSFNRHNTSSSLAAWPFYNASFLNDVLVVCNLPETAFVGSYTYSPVDNGAFGVAPFGDNDQVVEVKFVAGTTRSVSLDYLPQFVPGNPFDFTFDVVCSSVIPKASQATGVGCGAAILVGTPDPLDFGIVNPEDDSVINVTFLDLEVDGNCGAPASPIRFTLTKN